MTPEEEACEIIRRLGDLSVPGTDEESYKTFRPIPRLKWGSKVAYEMILKGFPVVLEGGAAEIAPTAMQWTPEYLLNFFADQQVTVFASNNRFFRYWDMKRHTGGYEMPPPPELRKMTFREFYECAKRDIREKSPRHYLQESLNLDTHPQLVQEVKDWDWSWVLKVNQECGWGPQSRNSMFVGLKGACSPAHYDQQENIFCQIRGHKRVVLSPPADWRCYYCFPSDHACDRQAMANPEKPDLEVFPAFRYARLLEADLGPGDAFFLPGSWFHQFSNMTDFCTSINFWSEPPPANVQDAMQGKLTASSEMALIRNVESMLAKTFPAASIPDLLGEWANGVPSRASKQVHEMAMTLLGNFMQPQRAELFWSDALAGRYGRDISEFVNWKEAPKSELPQPVLQAGRDEKPPPLVAHTRQWGAEMSSLLGSC
mmetsp:Transcript_55026/g.120674  ORF Transcript_55026/g.120674 Transcript_55026/m.120674 type:complete len:428 (+) Transcript_55026:32-1315(+)